MDEREKREILMRSGEAVRAARQQLGWSQEKLAAKAGLDRTYVGGIERGERNVAVLNIVRLAVALGTSPAALLHGISPPYGTEGTRSTR